MTTSGFYRRVEDSLQYGPTWILGPGVDLHKDRDSGMTTPIDGWLWYPDEDTARFALGMYVTMEDLTPEIETVLAKTVTPRLDRVDPPRSPDAETTRVSLYQKVRTAVSNE